MIDATKIRQDFPIYQSTRQGSSFVYLDSTSTSLKPRQVLDSMNEYYEQYSANVFRGIYKISERATQEYENARGDIASFIHAASPKEIIYTRNTTESINLVAYSWGQKHLHSGDEVVVSIMEHHSNFVPWQQLAKKNGFVLNVLGIEPNYEINYESLSKIITRRTKLLCLTAASNVLGTLVDVPRVRKIVAEIAPQCRILIDAAQAVPHMPVDVKAWGVDFIAFSSHKMLGPTGIGILWAKEEILEEMDPFLYGGDMIREVHKDTTVFNDLPHRFEAGTPNISGAIGLGSAVRYLSTLGMTNIREHEKKLVGYAHQALKEISGLTLYGPENLEHRGGVLSFRLDRVHPHDVAQVLDEQNICVRVGFHCAQPLHEELEIGPTVRASFYMYSTKSDIDSLVNVLERVKKLFL